MIAPIRDTTTTRDRLTAQRRKARRWIVESLLSRSDAAQRRPLSAGWKQWACVVWILLVAGTYFFKMLGGYFFD